MERVGFSAMKKGLLTLIGLGLLAITGRNAYATTLEVGEGRAFARIEAAYDAAKPEDSIHIYPLPNGRAYEGVALSVSKPNLSFLGWEGVKRESVRGSKPATRISGRGVNYTGAGRTPRAVFQFNLSATGCKVESLEIFGAHNDSHNGAAIRINEANDTTILTCDLHNNDMGIMSGGDVAHSTGANQQVLYCHIHHNGDATDPGYNHNLYMGGTSVTVLHCEIDHATTGHNFKSRAHFNWIGHCYIHDSANREVDLVDDKGSTPREQSHSVIVECVIVKAMEMAGNHTVIHWGQDAGSDHNGTLHLCHNTLITPYQSPVVDMDAPSAKVDMMYNLITDGGRFQNGQVLVQVSGGAKRENVSGYANVAARGFADKAQCAQTQTDLIPQRETVRFANPTAGDYRIDGASPAWLKVPSRALPAHLSQPNPQSEKAKKSGRTEDPTRTYDATNSRRGDSLIGALGMRILFDLRFGDNVVIEPPRFLEVREGMPLYS